MPLAARQRIDLRSAWLRFGCALAGVAIRGVHRNLVVSAASPGVHFSGQLGRSWILARKTADNLERSDAGDGDAA